MLEPHERIELAEMFIIAPEKDKDSLYQRVKAFIDMRDGCRKGTESYASGQLKKLVAEILSHVEGGRLCSIGGVDNTREVQIAVAIIEKWRKSFGELGGGQE